MRAAWDAWMRSKMDDSTGALEMILLLAGSSWLWGCISGMWIERRRRG